MPVMDGEEFLTRLRTEKKLDTPAVIASVDSTMPPELFELGHVYAKLKKPFDVVSLKEAVEAAFEI